MKLVYSYGATPLDPDEIEGLIPEHLQDQRDLNEWEQANILEAELCSRMRILAILRSD